MAAIYSASSAQTAYQAGLIRGRVQQARHEADQAQQNATSLQIQANAAQRAANRARENAHTLATETAVTPTPAAPTLHNSLPPRTSADKDAPLPVSPYALASQMLAASFKSVLNTQGQTTGHILDARA